MKKFEMTTERKTFFRRKLFRIKALISFGNIKAGEFGGYIEKEQNLAQDGDARVCGDADYTTIKGFGSVFRSSTFFRQKRW